MSESDTIASHDVRNFFKRWPTFYYVVMVVFGPAYFGGLSARAFLSKYKTEGKILNLGSGPRVLQKGVMNVDVYPYPGVDVVADIHSVPLPDGSVSGIVSDNVLEHVKDPTQAVREMHRLLEHGGYLYVSTPFMYPFHSSPHDFQRWTVEGLKELFHDFEVVETGVRSGIFSTLTVVLNHLFATIFSFGSPVLYSLLLNLVMLVTFPIKFLDVFFNHWPQSDTMASVLYCVVRKK